jgi:hypothetical protein
VTHRATIYVHYAALQVALLKAGELEASAALEDWAVEWLDFDAAELGEAMQDGATE